MRWWRRLPVWSGPWPPWSCARSSSWRRSRLGGGLRRRGLGRRLLGRGGLRRGLGRSRLGRGRLGGRGLLGRRCRLGRRRLGRRRLAVVLAGAALVAVFAGVALAVVFFAAVAFVAAVDFAGAALVAVFAGVALAVVFLAAAVFVAAVVRAAAVLAGAALVAVDLTAAVVFLAAVTFGDLAARDHLPECGTGLEGRHRCLLHLHRFAGARVARGTRVTRPLLEDTEAGNGHPVALGDGALHLAEDRIQRSSRCFPVPQSGGERLNELGLVHGIPPGRENWPNASHSARTVCPLTRRHKHLHTKKPLCRNEIAPIGCSDGGEKPAVPRKFGSRR